MRLLMKCGQKYETLMPVTDGNRTYAEWTAEFNCRLEEEDDLVKTIRDGVFQGGFDALKTTYAR